MKWDALRNHITAQAQDIHNRHPKNDPYYRRATATLALLPYCESTREAGDLEGWMFYGPAARTSELATVEALSRRYTAENWAL